MKSGNNKNNEIEKVIFHINSYKAEADVTVKSNKNTNKYKLLQEVSENKEYQKVLEPEAICGTEFLLENGVLKITNSKINAEKIYEKYPSLTNNFLFLTDFLKEFQKVKNENSSNFEKTVNLKSNNSCEILLEINTRKNVNEDKISSAESNWQETNIRTNNEINKFNFVKAENSKAEIIEKDENVILKLKENSKYSSEIVVTFDKNAIEQLRKKSKGNSKGDAKVTMQIFDSSKNERIYIIYNNIEFNMWSQERTTNDNKKRRYVLCGFEPCSWLGARRN